MDDLVYKRCCESIAGYIKSQKLSEPPANYINESWLFLIENNSPIDEVAIVKKAKSLIVRDSIGVFKFNSRAITKVCNCCHEELPIALFSQKWVKRLGRHVTDYICKKCKNKKSSHWVKNNLSKYRNLSRAYRERMPDSYITINLRKQGVENPTKGQIRECRERLLLRRAKVKISRTV